MPQQNIFRQSVIDRLSAPEELDKTIKVTDRKGWIALIGFVSVVVVGIIWSIVGSIPEVLPANGILVKKDGLQNIGVSDAGLLTSLSVKVGDSVKEGQVIGKYKNSQGNDTDIVSNYNGTLTEVLGKVNNPVKPDVEVAQVELNVPMEALIFLPLADGKRVHPGVEVRITPSTVRSEDQGYLLGIVKSVSATPVNTDNLYDELKNKDLVGMVAGGGATIEVEVQLQADTSTVSGYKWSSPRGPNLKLENDTLFQSSIILGEQHPISLVLPILRNEDN